MRFNFSPNMDPNVPNLAKKWEPSVKHLGLQKFKHHLLFAERSKRKEPRPKLGSHSLKPFLKKNKRRTSLAQTKDLPKNQRNPWSATSVEKQVIKHFNVKQSKRLMSPL